VCYLVRGFVRAFDEIVGFLSKVRSLVDLNQIELMVNILVKARREGRKVLVVGAGRSGLVGRAFALRLMHLGFNVYVYGETIVPAIGDGDVVVVISGSGETASSVLAAETAKRVGARVIAVTSRINSKLARLADHVVVVPGRTKLARESDYFVRQLVGEHEPLSPLGTLFEIAAFVVLDCVVVELMMRLGVSEEEVYSRHANIE